MIRKSYHRVAVIGAGIAGSTAARTLTDHGHEVTLFEKSRGPGGRMARRQRGLFEWDFGAQYLTARDPIFLERVSRWVADGVLSEWQLRLADVRLEPDGRVDVRSRLRSEPRYVPSESMTRLCKELCGGLEVVASRKVLHLDRTEEGWFLLHQANAKLVATSGEIRRSGPFDAAVVAVPAEQSVPLLADAPEIQSIAGVESMHPCWAGLVGLPEPLQTSYDGAFVEHPVLSWVARNNSKPHREAAEAWVLHATTEWSREHLELPPEQAAPLLLEAFQSLLPGLSLPEPEHLEAHRWRFARSSSAPAPGPQWDGHLAIGACGDWSRGDRVEDAFLSGIEVATRILTQN